ncbi:unnamed protein product [Macrosiphum euphorbiae]|uniref:HAT C-terminal dimerisation domain-containing protein n=1 Tax=Macrosiphum euphorbiae TaxID=13131 RepID=A0AAV0XAY5_9HEMI|nr:unnamed protein product [Macrosiphum euphorbiae]
MGLTDLKLIQECKTRWNSAYHMMERILKLKEPVLSTLAITNYRRTSNYFYCTNSTSIWKQFDEQVSSVLGQNNPSVASIVELDKYLSENLLNRQLHPLKWWSERKLLYPRLFEMVKRRLCVPATSVSSERVFSKAGMILNSKRTRLTTEKVEKIIFIQSNM